MQENKEKNKLKLRDLLSKVTGQFRHTGDRQTSFKYLMKQHFTELI